ncbi:MAG: dihydroorotate dehydrogenase electron transfer subunit [Bacteroidia bacterium]|nr:dihydroorotate dehydrogenase electron transfer subunit [Bacteroidia bacterium]
MEKHVFTIESNVLVAKDTFRLELAADDPQLLVPGEFVDIAIEGFYLRRPLSICDRTPGHIILIYKTVGQGTKELAKMVPGGRLDILTGLGRGFDPDACKRNALLVAGGLGAAPLYLLCKELKAQGKKVTVVLGFNREDEIVLADEFKAVCDSFAIATLDGSAGYKGFVTDAIAAMKPEYDFFYTCGPMVMMKNVCAMLEGDGEASLEERMGCGAGFCYGCSCHTKGGTKRICKDGPVFKKEDIIW